MSSPPDLVASQLAAMPNLLAILETTAQRRPEEAALTLLHTPLDPDPRALTYAEVLEQTLALCAALRARGVGPSDGVAILLPAMPESVIALIAASTVGVAFPVNMLLSAEALAGQLTLAKAKAAIVLAPSPASDIRQRLVRAATQVPGLATIVEVGAPEPGLGLSWAAFLEEGRNAPQLDFAHDSARVSALFHTGGTTGAPKLAQLTAGNLAAGALMAAHAIGWRAGDQLLLALPMFHVAGAIDSAAGSIAAGANLIFPTLLGARNPDLIPNIWRVVAQTQATILGLVPTSLAGAVEASLEGADLSSLRAIVTGAAALPAPLAARLEAVLGRPVCQVYGMTESSGIIAAQPTDGLHRDVAVGFAPPLMEVRLEDMGDGLGEIQVTGPNVFAGYRSEAGETGLTPDGWLASGDLGRIGPDGQMRLAGRSKDVIIRSGHNVDPAAIEDVALRHPAVLQAAAVPMPDTYAGELPVLYVCLRPDAVATEEEIARFVTERIAEPPARPRHVFIVPDLPLTLIGKIARFRLRQTAAIHRAGVALEGLPVESLSCEDAAAKQILMRWAEGAPEAAREVARARLGELGLSCAEAAG